MKIEIVPAILDQTLAEIKEKIERIKPLVGRIGIDIIDGIFVDNLTVGVADLEEVDFGELKVDIQLMTEYPEELLGECHQAGVHRVFGHIEKMGSQRSFVEMSKELVLQPGFGLDLFTPIDAIEKSMIKEISGVLLMSVEAGFSGQEFNPIVLNKIRELREQGFEGDIMMDGGINPKTIKSCVEAGANQFSVTSYFWKNDDLSQALTKLHQSV